MDKAIKDICPVFLSPADRISIRNYLEASSHHAICNADALKALNSIETLQGQLESIRDHIISCETACDIDPDLLMMYVIGKL